MIPERLRFTTRCGFLYSPRGIVIIALIVGLAIRFLVMPFTYEYDMYHWAVVIQNIESGNGLYELNGYFYTPVWGYILGAIDMFWNTFLSVDVFGQQFTEFLSVEDLENMNHVATVTSPEFNFGIKIPLVVVDLAIGTIVYCLVKSLTEDPRKSAIGFFLWMLCPIAIYMSSIQGMFDNISGLLTLLSIILVLRRHYILGGFILCIGMLLKLYPAFALPVIMALIYARSGRTHQMVREVSMLFVGGITAFVIIMLPTVCDGTFSYAFTFITDRSGILTGPDAAFWFTGIALAAIVMLYATYAMATKGREKTDMVFLKYTLLALVGGILANTGPQYPLVLIPLLCVYIASVDRSYFICWILIGFGCTMQALVLNNFSLLMSVTGYWGWFPFDFVVDGMESMETYIFGTNSLRSLLNSLFQFVGIAGLVLAILFEFEEGLCRRLPRIGSALRAMRRIGMRDGGATDA